MQLETISCPLCDSGEFKTVFRAGDFRFRTVNEKFDIAECRDCGFIFLNPRPAKAEISRFYPSDFNRSDRSLFYGLLKPCFWMAQESTIRSFKRYKKNGMALDIGCGNGEFTLAMQRHGFDAWGVEPNAGAEKFADTRLKGRILYQDIKECAFTSKSFDIITMFQSLEHIYDLQGLFVEIKRVLKDDGILYICVPDSAFFEARLFGPYYYNLEVPRHLYFFTKNSLKAFLLNHGFKSIRFLRGSLCEMFSTPASFYHGLWYFLADKGVRVNNAVRFISYLPLAIIRLMLRMVFFFQGQNLKALCPGHESR